MDDITPQHTSQESPQEPAQQLGEKKKLAERIKAFMTPKNQRIAAGIAGGIFAAGALSIIAVAQYRRQINQPGDLSPVSQATEQAQATPTPNTAAQVPGMLDGTLVAGDAAQLRPLAVVIENHPQARPQSGLGSASIVYETEAEGGITRFLALFQDARVARRVGPVRSARIFFVDLANEYQALFAHVGGNILAIQDLPKRPAITDLDQFSVGGAAFARDTSKNVALEHTMYARTDQLWEVGLKRSSNKTTSTMRSWQFRDPLNPAPTATASVVSIPQSGASYVVKWTYDTTSSGYLRELAGAPHRDSLTGSQITTKNVVVQFVSREQVQTSSTVKTWKLDLTSGGSGKLFQEGVVTDIKWSRDKSGRTLYTNATTGQEVTFLRGQTWIHLVPTGASVTVQ